MLDLIRHIFFSPPRDRRAEGRKFAETYTGPRSDLENFVDSAKLFGGFDDFDRGIEDALREPRDA